MHVFVVVVVFLLRWWPSNCCGGGLRGGGKIGVGGDALFIYLVKALMEVFLDYLNKKLYPKSSSFPLLVEFFESLIGFTLLGS